MHEERRNLNTAGWTGCKCNSIPSHKIKKNVSAADYDCLPVGGSGYKENKFIRTRDSLFLQCTILYHAVGLEQPS